MICKLISDSESMTAWLMIVRYPPKMIPGCHITLHTTAKADKDARLLLSAMGIPFYGKLVH